MKSVVILYAAELSEHAFEKAFENKSAFELTLEWSKNVPGREKTFVFTSSENHGKIENLIKGLPGADFEAVSKESWTKGLFVSQVSKILQEQNSDYAVISYADTPFLNSGLTDEICSAHEKYQAEYTFADGYPYGLAPETLDKGAAGILSAIIEASHKEKADEKMSRDAVFSLLSLDINSFEIETVIAEKDYRLLRLEFECCSKINFEGCKSLFNIEKKSSENFSFSDFDFIKLCDDASSSENVLKTVPAFYNVQISAKYNHNLSYEPVLTLSENPAMKDDMDFQNFKNLLKKIAGFSEKAVISLSAFGEPLLNKNFFDFVAESLEYRNFSILIETDGTLLDECLAAKISNLPSSKDKISWIVLVDAMDKNLYSKIHGCDESDFDKALLAVQVLEKYFPGNVYPQFVRMKSNESSLESFYRFWKSPDSPSHGKFIIQKHNSFCGLLPDEKPADLSPLERNPCWKLRRDMTVLCDGSVPECLNQFNKKDKIFGNAFDEDLEEIWRKFDENLKNQTGKKYSGLCKACDEHYTFNF